MYHFCMRLQVDSKFPSFIHSSSFPSFPFIQPPSFLPSATLPHLLPLSFLFPHFPKFMFPSHTFPSFVYFVYMFLLLFDLISLLFVHLHLPSFLLWFPNFFHPHISATRSHSLPYFTHPRSSFVHISFIHSHFLPFHSPTSHWISFFPSSICPDFYSFFHTRFLPSLPHPH